MAMVIVMERVLNQSAKFTSRKPLTALADEPSVTAGAHRGRMPVRPRAS